MASDSPPQPDKAGGCNLRGQLFSIAGDGTLDFLSAMQGVMVDGAAILDEEPEFPATAKPGDLLLTVLWEGKVRMAYISTIDVGGVSDQEDGSSSGSDSKDKEGSGSDATTFSYATDESDEEEQEQDGSNHTDDEEEEDEPDHSAPAASSTATTSASSPALGFAAATGSTLFGSTSPAPLFGNTAASSPATTATATAPSLGFSLSPSTTASAPSFGFTPSSGSTTTASTTSSLFSSAPSASAFSFSSSASAAPSTPASAPASCFSLATSQAASAPSMFSNTGAAASSSASSLFGSSFAAPTPTFASVSATNASTVPSATAAPATSGPSATGFSFTVPPSASSSAAVSATATTITSSSTSAAATTAFPSFSLQATVQASASTPSVLFGGSATATSTSTTVTTTSQATSSAVQARSGGKDKERSDAKYESDEEEQEEDGSTHTDGSISYLATHSNDKEEGYTEKEVKQKKRHMHIRVWQEYCVLVFFEDERWKLTKQQPIHWLQEDQIKETHDKIRTENERNEVDMTRNLDVFDLSKQMCKLGFSGRLVSSEAVDKFITSELSPNIIDYKIMEVLGTGATSKVYYADTKYAIKKMKLDKKFDDKDARQNKEPREVTILSSLRNSSVVSFFQAWAADGIFKSFLKGSSSSSEGDDEDSESADDLENEGVPRYVAIQMEHCNRTLRNFLDDKDRQMDVEEAWFLLKEITKAIQFIHRRGVIHRDLKPANIFFGDADGNTIKIGDFGHGCWAKQYAADEGGTPKRGTKGYCAPELDGEGGEKPASPTEKADIYSIGIILVELFHLFGSGYRRIDVLENLRNDQYPDPAESNWYGDVTLLKKLVASCPSQRPSADEILEYISTRQ